MLSFLKSQDTSKVFTMLASVAASAILVRTIYEAVDTYLVNEVSSSVSRLEVRKDEDMKRLVTNLEINEEIVDIFKNVEARWRLILKHEMLDQGRHAKYMKSYELTFNKKHEQMVLNSYLPYIMERGKAIREESKVKVSDILEELRLCAGDGQIIVFTTNHIDMLDLELLTLDLMNMHIHMPYCTTSAFNQIAFNHFNISYHILFEEIEGLIKKVEVTLAEVSGELLKSNDAEVSLQGLIKFLHNKIVEYDKLKA
ncbi:hypothetical protein POTOM_039817 [Populus tomentosa]|uniref:ATPase AAA-type core domain-containing protein n=1 Tax=Populus tomentosa TaxID=118781 RepID=A0A8X7YSD2_POPTO|nr:hypothetical protein POTOM_039817 [Populus tomentosa]